MSSNMATDTVIDEILALELKAVEFDQKLVPMAEAALDRVTKEFAHVNIELNVLRANLGNGEAAHEQYKAGLAKWIAAGRRCKEAKDTAEALQEDAKHIHQAIVTALNTAAGLTGDIEFGTYTDA